MCPFGYTAGKAHLCQQGIFNCGVDLTRPKSKDKQGSFTALSSACILASMALHLEIREGNDVGTRFLLAPGLRIGRNKGDIAIDDAKASALHAMIEQDRNGAYFVKDLNSTNGIKINGLKVPFGPLEVGSRLQVGRTLFLVIEIPVGLSQLATSKRTPSNHWTERVQIALTGLPLQSRSPDPKLSVFSPAIQLHFLEGVQAASVVTLGYGPRKAGQDSLDIMLLEEEAPDLAFEVIPNEDGDPLFTTPFPAVVKVNDLGYESRVLYAGDLIRIGKTLIRVGFIQE
jgi:hypothetical protein